jgi:hypothetical protein
MHKDDAAETKRHDESARTPVAAKKGVTAKKVPEHSTSTPNACPRRDGISKSIISHSSDDARQTPCAVTLLHAGPSQRPFFAKGMPPEQSPTRPSTPSIANAG